MQKNPSLLWPRAGLLSPYLACASAWICWNWGDTFGVIDWLCSLRTLHLPGISVILVAVAEDTHDASAALRVESVESALQGLVHRQQRDIDQAGNLSTARPIRLWDNGKSHVLDVGSGGGARDVRRVVVAHIQQADSYGAIVPRSFLQVRRQIAQLRTCWMSWDSFRQLCLRSGACPSASQQEYQCVCRAFERNALAVGMN